MTTNREMTDKETCPNAVIKGGRHCTCWPKEDCCACLEQPHPPIAEPAKAPMSEFFRRERPKFSESGRVYRRFCTCMCHRTGAKHVMACCLPDPPFSEWPLKAKSAPQPVIDDAKVESETAQQISSNCPHCGRQLSVHYGTILPCYPCSLKESKPLPSEPPAKISDLMKFVWKTYPRAGDTEIPALDGSGLRYGIIDRARVQNVELSDLHVTVEAAWLDAANRLGFSQLAAKPSEPAEGERGVKPCLCGASPCIGVKKLRTGYACIREVGLATLAAKDEKVEESSDAAEVLRAVDATLCACRRNRCERPADCNCDIHAAHRLIDDYFRELKKRSVGGVK